MLGRVLLILGAVHVASKILVLLGKVSSEDEDDRISELPDDLLIKILCYLPTKDAVGTMFLSKRWQTIWSMVPRLEYKEDDSDYYKGWKKKESSFWWFLEASLQRHKALVLTNLTIQLGPRCPVGVDDDDIIRKCIVNAVDRKVSQLLFKLSKPTSITTSRRCLLPESLYVCDTLVLLKISNKTLVDVDNSPVFLPSLKVLFLYNVVYKDDDTLVKLLSGCPILKRLFVVRHNRDNLINVSVKVPSLETLSYVYTGARNMAGSLFIDSANLKFICLVDYPGITCSLENQTRLATAFISVCYHLDDKFVTSLSFVTSLDLTFTFDTVQWCQATNFSQLINCTIRIIDAVDWFEPFMRFLQNSPKIKFLRINQPRQHPEYFAPSFNRPSSVPQCLSSHLEFFEWREYGGSNPDRELIRYILANSMHLKKAEIFIGSTQNHRKKMMKELKPMSRVSTQLLFPKMTQKCAPKRIKSPPLLD